MARISQLSRMTFYKYTYFMMNAIINIVVRDYSEISFTESSDRIEIFIGFYSIKIFRERYFRSGHSSKILLLLNYFIFVKLFALASFSDRWSTLFTFVLEGYFLFQRGRLISINIEQYWEFLTTVSLWLVQNIINLQKPAIWKRISYLLQTSTLWF